MASFRNTYNDSPVLAMSPQAAHQTPFDKPPFPHRPLSFSQSASWSDSPIQRLPSAAGRKRSRDEAAVNLDPPEKLVEPPIKEAEDEWVYGPGMILIKRSSCYVADASSQSGTWVEDKVAEEEKRKTEAALLAREQLSQERPSLRSHKSQRLEVTTSLGHADGIRPGNSHSSLIQDSTTSPSNSASQPVVDDFTFHLGIGWSRISDDAHIQAAARGWARYIENHFPLSDVKIRLESRGLQSYLVEANEGFFLFAENLRQGRLVSKDVGRTLEHLKTSPPTFEGVETMAASERCGGSLADSETVGVATSTDMDMS
ncbi:hypothetical protein VTK73DRAFT_1143 [Phialemonium thermophilum]|uniref:Uncharacterized protein n=1 Tax=Phialemonium thermophilum TaxID=223376 RepID=A0ABR3XAY7_9PEZI